MRINAHAKINWYLLVRDRRPDGYHELQMLMQRLQLHDELELLPAPSLSLQVEGTGQAELQNDDNLILKAAKALQAETGCSKGAGIRLQKRIPLRSGLGGGSADAAATLLALNQLWELGLPLQTLQQIGLKVGADVPYCLMKGPALAEGIGEKLTPVYLGPAHWLVLLLPEGGLSTGEVFKKLRIRRHPRDIMRRDTALDGLQRGDFGVLRMACINHLEEPASQLMPAIPQLIRELKAAGAPFAQMTGAGSAVFGVFEAKEKASTAWQSLRERHGVARCLLTQTIP